MTRKEMLELLKVRGNWTLSYLCDSSNGLVSSTFQYNPDEEEKNARVPIPEYCCEVFPDKSFRFVYVLRKSGNTLYSPKCSPISNEEHFERIQTQFEHNAAALEKYGM